MLIDSVIINLIHTGTGLSPVYNITIYGYGKVIYEGLENVKVKGLKETVIADDYIVLILDELKRSNFFSLKENYSSNGVEHKPCTTISVSIPKNENEFIKKTVRYCQGDREVPKELKILVGKIEDIIDSEKWVGKYENFIQKKQESIEKKEIPIEKKVSSIEVKKIPSRLIGIIIVIFVVISLLTFSVYSGLLKFPTDAKNNQDKVIYGSNLEINKVEPAKNVDFDTGNYTVNTIFKINDFIYIIQKYTNISTINSELCNLYLDIIVSYNNTIYHTDTENRTYIGKSIQVWYFKTNDLWPIGEYLVTVNLKDNISNTTATSKTTKFFIT